MRPRARRAGRPRWRGERRPAPQRRGGGRRPRRLLAQLAERRRRRRNLSAVGRGRVGRARTARAAHRETRPIWPAAEQTIRRASYKDTDAKLARFNRRMSLPISIALIRTPLTANQLSVDARGDRVLFGVAVQHRALLGRRARRLPVARRQRARRLRRRDRAAQVPGVGARLLDRNRSATTRTTSRSSSG